MAVSLVKPLRGPGRPATQAVIARSRALGRAYQKNPYVLGPWGKKPPKPPATTAGAAAGAGAATGTQPKGTITPNYEDLIAGDWQVQGAEQAGTAKLQRVRGQFGTDLRQNLINLGLTDQTQLGDLAGKLSPWLDPDTLSLAQSNPNSIYAQIGQNATRAQAQSEAALAARGILSSGETTSQAGQIAGDAEQNRYQALQDFLGGARTGLGGIAQAEEEVGAATATARGEAGARLAEQYPIKTVGAGTGYLAGSNGKYLSQAAFKALRPKGSYKSYLAYLTRKRGGLL